MSDVDMGVFDAMEATNHAEHDRIMNKVLGKPRKNERPDGSVIAQVSMPRAQKERFVAVSKAHGISLSAFLRLAADEYIRVHGWE